MLFDTTTPSPAGKTIRILVYPNITYAKDIAKDSFVQYLATVISKINQLRTDVFWTVWMPERTSALELPNTLQVDWPLPTHAPAMRVHFDVLRAKSLLSTATDVDVVWSHLPEATHALYSTLVNLTHHRPAIFGYAHWFDLSTVTTWDGDSFRENLSGLLHMQRCYLNTQTQKNLVLAQASTTYTSHICDRLNTILVPHPPGVPAQHVVSSIDTQTEKVIVFNHRPDVYKDFPAFLAAMRELRTHRQDFTVWVPLLNTSPEPWIITDKHEKAEYYRLLRLARVGVAPKQNYGGWSISATDGLMNGCPYIFYDAEYYKELHPTADTFSRWPDAITLLHRYLDDLDYRNRAAQAALTQAQVLSQHTNAQVHAISDYITQLTQKLPAQQTDTVKQIAHYIRAHKSVSKAAIIKSLNWGRGIGWTKYRRALLAHPNIFDTVGPEPIYQWVD